MILAVVCFILATVISIILWQNTNKQGWKIKAGIICGYIIVLAICSQYINLSKAVSGGSSLFEGFEVQIPELDAESGIGIHNINSPAYNGNNAFIDADEREQLQENKVKPVNKIKSLSELDMLAKSDISVKLPEKAAFQDTATGDDNSNSNGNNTGELRNAFNPQIIIYGDGNNGSSGSSGQNNNSLSLSNQQTSLNSSVSSVNSAISSSTNNFNVAPRAIDEYLRPRSDIFNTNNPAPGTDPFEWMTRFFNQNAGSHNSGDTATCPISKPYAEEGRGRFNTATLTNRTYVPGMSYMPPTEWNVPQYHPTTCRQVCNNTFIDTRALPIGIMDPGTPIFALEIGGDGTIAKTESDVTLTNVGSIMPKFTYREYVDCPQMCQNDYMPTTTTTTRPVTNTTGYAATTTTRPVTNTTGYAATTTTLPVTSTTGYATTTTTLPVTSTTGYATTTTTLPVTSTTGYATTTTNPMTSTTGYATSTTSPVTSTTSPMTSTTGYATSTTSPMTSTTFA
jgi:hypothetical protein